MKTSLLLPALLLTLPVSTRALADEPDPSHKPRLLLQAARAESMMARLAVSEYWFAHKSWPANASQTTYRPTVKTRIDEGGIITITMQGPDEELDGTSLQLTPVPAPGDVIEWKCTSKDVPRELLPDSCK